MTRVAIIGCGAAARRIHLPALRAAGATVSVFASRTIDSARAAAKEWGGGEVTDDWSAAVARDDVDAVVVCAPNILHAPVAIAAARAGKHVLVEKPMATTLTDADAMIDAADRAGVILVPAHNARFEPVVRAVAEAAGSLGVISRFYAALGHPGPLSWSAGADWFFDPEVSGGGALLDLGVHLADILRVVLDDEFDRVAAMTDVASIERMATVTAHTTRGATGSFQVSWISPVPEMHLTLMGEHGIVEATGAGAPTVARPGEPLETLRLPPETDEPMAGFLRACAGHGPAAVTGADGRAALAVVRAARLAARTGSTVDVGKE